MFEGADDFQLGCTARGSANTYSYVWTGRGGTVVPGRLSSVSVARPTFDVPDEVTADQTYEYTWTASALNANDGVRDFTVTVKNKPDLIITCPGNPYSEYEGEEDFDLDCSVTGAPSGSTAEYEWTARGNTPDTDDLSSTTIAQPKFDVPG